MWVFKLKHCDSDLKQYYIHQASNQENVLFKSESVWNLPCVVNSLKCATQSDDCQGSSFETDEDKLNEKRKKDLQGL